VIKLLSRIDNLPPSSTQPTTPTTFTTPPNAPISATTPPAMNVAGLTPILPPIVGLSGPVAHVAPSMVPLVNQCTSSLSPIVGSNPSTPAADVAPTPLTHIPRTYSNSVVSDIDVQKEVGERPMIRLMGGG